MDIVVRRIGLEIGYRFKADARKVKFVVKGPLPPNNAFPKFTDFEIVHHYLQVFYTKRKILQYCCTKEHPEKVHSFLARFMCCFVSELHSLDFFIFLPIC